MDVLQEFLGKSLETNQLIVLVMVFLAVCLPIACWRRETVAARDVPLGDWKRLPGLFRTFWQPASLFASTVGQSFVLTFPGIAKKYEAWIEVASLPMTARHVFVIKVLMAPLFGLLGGLFFLVPRVSTGLATVVVIVFVVIGWMYPAIALQSFAKKRQEEIVKALPFAIDLMGSAMRSGLDFGAAMRYYTNLGLGGALEYEFTRVVRDASLGKPLAESIQDMAGRMRIPTFTAFAGVIAYGTEIGASIADTLKLHGAEMRRERFSIAEQKAARAPSVMILPIAVFILPAVFLIIFVPVMLQFLASQAK